MKVNAESRRRSVVYLLVAQSPFKRAHTQCLLRTSYILHLGCPLKSLWRQLWALQEGRVSLTSRANSCSCRFAKYAPGITLAAQLQKQEHLVVHIQLLVSCSYLSLSEVSVIHQPLYWSSTLDSILRITFQGLGLIARRATSKLSATLLFGALLLVGPGSRHLLLPTLACGP